MLNEHLHRRRTKPSPPAIHEYWITPHGLQCTRYIF